MEKSKYKFSMFKVVIVFLILYFGELGLGYGIFVKFIQPNLKSATNTKLTQQKAANAAENQYISLIKQTQSLNQISEYKEASNSAVQALSFASNDEEKGYAYYWIGFELYKQGDYQQAQEDVLISNKLEPKTPYGYDILSAISNKNKDYQQALVYAKALIAALPNYAPGFVDASSNEVLLGDSASAITYINKAIKLDPSNQADKDLLSALKGASNSDQPTLGYAISDVSTLVAALNQADTDTQNLKTYYLGDPTNYDQTKVNQVLGIIAQRKGLAQSLLDKMGKNLPLDTEDESNLKQYNSLTSQEDSLMNSLNSHPLPSIQQ